jgi:hypothetical protein
LGGSVTNDVAGANYGTSSTVRNLASYAISTAGVYLVNAVFNFGTVVNDAQFTKMSCGISSANNTLPTTGPYAVSHWNFDGLYTLQFDGVDRRPVSCVLRLTGSGTIFFNFVSEFNTPTNTNIGCSYTITRIG